MNKIKEQTEELWLLKKLIKKEKIELTDVYAETTLINICEKENTSCSDKCLVFKEVLSKKQKRLNICPYIRDGKLMLSGLRGNKIFIVVIDGERHIISEPILRKIKKTIKTETVDLEDV